MICKFTTSIDCAKKFMSNISGLSINPMIGDSVRIYHDSELNVYMKVTNRTWIFTNGSNPELICSLSVDDPIEFSKMIEREFASHSKIS